MAKASKKSTPDIPALPAVPISPEQAAIWRAQAEEMAKFQAKFARAIDDAIGIETGQRRPKWARPKRRRDGKQSARVKEVLRERYPPEGRAPEHLTIKELCREILDPEFEKRGWKLASPDTVARASGRRRQ
jgi:hypothetical protein